MRDFGSVTIPIDLVRAALNGSEPRGWFGGAKLTSENVFVAVSLHNAEQHLLSKFANRLYSHRAFDGRSAETAEQVLLWVRVPKDLDKALPSWPIVNQHDAESALGIDINTEVQFICALQRTEKSPRVRAYLIYSKEQVSMFLPLEAIVLYAPNPYAGLPKQSTAALASKSAMIVGVGSGGGEVATLLACAGLGTLVLVDFDRIEPRNYLRHILDRRHLGRRKALALDDALFERELRTRISTQTISIVSDANKFRAAVVETRPNLLICATDSRASRSVVNHCAVNLEVPAVIAGILGDGRIAEVLFVEPRRTPCYECIRLELASALETPPGTETPTTPYTQSATGEPQASIQRLDIGFAASLATRVALQVLDPDTYERLPTSYVVWAREKTNYREPFKFELPLSLNYVSLSKRAECPVCGLPQPELAGVNVNDRFTAIIGELDSVSPPEVPEN